MAPRIRGKSSLNVLFIGNSFSARNDLPGLIAQLAVERGKTMHHALESAGGASLRTHWNSGEALKAIKNSKYDCVVLQEQSTLPIKNANRMHENVRLFDEAIKAGGAQTVLYMTWARRHPPATQAAITEAYSSIGRELGANRRAGRPRLADLSGTTRSAGLVRQGPEAPQSSRLLSRSVRLPRGPVPGKPGWTHRLRPRLDFKTPRLFAGNRPEGVQVEMTTG